MQTSLSSLTEVHICMCVFVWACGGVYVHICKFACKLKIHTYLYILIMFNLSILGIYIHIFIMFALCKHSLRAKGETCVCVFVCICGGVCEHIYTFA